MCFDRTLDMFAIPARRGAMTRVERRNAVVTIITVLFVVIDVRF